VETDAADGNPLTTRIPTAAWKAQNAFHSSHKARRRFHHRIHFFERQRSTLNTLSFGPKDGEHLTWLMPSRVRLLNRKTQISAAAFLVRTLAALDSIDSISQRIPGQPWCCNSAGLGPLPTEVGSEK
jgi:hypothetical protein